MLFKLFVQVLVFSFDSTHVNSSTHFCIPVYCAPPLIKKMKFLYSCVINAEMPLLTDVCKPAGFCVQRTKCNASHTVSMMWNIHLLWGQARLGAHLLHDSLFIWLGQVQHTRSKTEWKDWVVLHSHGASHRNSQFISALKWTGRVEMWIYDWKHVSFAQTYLRRKWRNRICSQ